MFLNDWKDGGFIEMVGDFEDIHISKDEYEATESPYPNATYWLEKKSKMRSALADPKWDIEVLLASYSYAEYQGDAFVLFRKDGDLYEVNGGHCSCHGLEGQWEPEKTSIIALLDRIEKGQLGNDEWSGNVFAVELKQVLAELLTVN